MKRVKIAIENKSSVPLRNTEGLDTPRLAGQVACWSSGDQHSASRNKEVLEPLAMQISSAPEHQQDSQPPETVNLIDDEISGTVFESSDDVRDEGPEISSRHGGADEQSGTDAISNTSKTTTSPLKPYLEKPVTIDNATFRRPSEVVLPPEQSQSTSRPFSQVFTPPVREERRRPTTRLQDQIQGSIMLSLHKSV